MNLRRFAPEFPFSLVSSKGFGITHSSNTKIGDHLFPSRSLGRAQLNCYANTLNGNLVVQDRLLSLTDIGGEIQFGYIYNSLIASPSQRWHLGFGRQIKLPVTEKMLTVIEQDGEEIQYEYNAQDDSYQATRYIEGMPCIKFNADLNQYSWSHPKTREQEVFDADGYLIERIDSKGNATRYEYTSEQSLKTIIAPSGVRYEVERTADKVEIYLHKEGEEKVLLHTYLFDEAGNLRKSITPDKYEINGYITHYEYDNDSAQLTRVEQADESLLRFSYYNNESGEVNKLKNIQVGRERVEGKSSFYTLHYGEGTCLFEDAAGITSQLAFDQQGNITSFSQALEDDKRFEYNAAGQVKNITYPDNSTEKFEYNSQGLLQKHVHRSGRVTELTYVSSEISGKPLLSKKSDYASETDSQPLQTYHYVYDAFRDKQDFPRYEILPSGRVKEYSVDAKTGLLASERNYLHDFYPSSSSSGEITLEAMKGWAKTIDYRRTALVSYFYDEQGRVEKTLAFARVDEDGKGIVDEETAEKRFTYDSYGRPISENVKQDSTEETKTEYNYSPFGELRRKIEAQGQVAERSTLFIDKGAMKFTIHPSLRMDTQSYDSQGLLIAESKTSESKAGKEQIREEYQRGLNGEVNVVTEDNQESSYLLYDKKQRLAYSISPGGAVTEYEYSSKQRYRIETKYANTIDAKALLKEGFLNRPDEKRLKSLLDSAKDLKHDRKTYQFSNEHDKIRYEVDAESGLTEYVYNALGQLIHKISYEQRLSEEERQRLLEGGVLNREFNRKTEGGKEKEDRVYSYFYDQDGLKVGEQDPEGYVVSYVRDAAGRIEQEKRYAAPCFNLTAHFSELKLDESDEDNASTYYLYNALNQCITEVDPQGYVTRKDYYASGKVKASTRYEHPVSAAWYENTHVQPDVILSKNNEATYFFYDALNRLVKKESSQGQVTTYSYDEMDRQTATYQTDKENLGKVTGDYCRGSELRYDALGRVIAELSPLAAQQLKAIDMNDALSAEEKVQEKEKIWQTQSTRHFYNKTLKVKTIDPMGNATHFYYDQEQRPVVKVNAAGSVTENVYNAFGEITKERQFAKSIAPETLVTLSGGVLEGEVKKLLAELADNKRDVVTTFEHDKRGHVTKKTDAEEFVRHYNYNAFGECKGESLLENEESALQITYRYDKRGLLLGKSQFSKDSDFAMQLTFRDNLYGHETRKVDENNFVTEHYYDRLGRLKKQTKEVEKGKSLTIKTCEYDAFNRVKRVVDADKRETTYEYDDRLRKTVVTHPDQTQETLVHNVFSDTVKHITEKGEEEQAHSPLGEVLYHKDACGRESRKELDSLARLKWEDRNGLQTEYVYDGLHLKEKTEDLKGVKRKTTYQKDAFGRDQVITNPKGVKTVFAYDKRHHCIETIIDPKDEKNPEGLHLIAKAEYNAHGSLTKTTETDHEGKKEYTTVKHYDGFNREKESVIDPQGLALSTQSAYDNKSQQTKIIDAKGHVTRIYFDGLGRKRFSLVPKANGEKGCLLAWEYNASGAIISQRIYAAPLNMTEINDSTPLAAFFAHPQSEQDNVTLTLPDAMNRPQFEVKTVYDAKTLSYQCIVSEKRYDKGGCLSLVVDYAASFPAKTLSDVTLQELKVFASQQAGNDKNRFARTLFNALGEPLVAINTDGRISEKFYDESGPIIMERHRINRFEKRDLLLTGSDEEIENALAAVPTNDQADLLQFFIYDTLGRKTHTIDSAGNVIKLSYDDNDNVVEQISFSQRIAVSADYSRIKDAALSLVLDPDVDRVITKKYDSNDRMIEMTDAQGHTEHFFYDAGGNQYKHIDKANQEWEYEYDKAKRRQLVRSPEITLSTIKRDSSLMLSYEESTARIEKELRYDKLGNTECIIEGKGLENQRVFWSTFDAANKLLEGYVKDASVDERGQAAPTRFQYLPLKWKKVGTQCDYDIQGRIIAEKDENDHWTFYVYDTLGRPQYVCAKNGAVTQYTYNAFDQPVKVNQYANTITLDRADFLKASNPLQLIEEQLKPSEQDRVNVIHYNKAGEIEEIEKGAVFYYANGEYGLANPLTRKQYDAFGRCISEAKLISPNVWAEKRTWFDSAGNKFAEMDEDRHLTRYEYNAFGQEEKRCEYANPLALVPLANATWNEMEAFISPSEKDRHYRYEYNKNGKKTADIQENVTVQALHFTEAGIPQLVDVHKDLVKRYEYDSMDRLIKVTHEDGGEEHTFYNARGDVIAETKVPRTRIDEKGDKTVLTPVVTYGVDAFGQRVRVTEHQQSYEIDRGFDPAKVKVEDKDRTQLVSLNERGLVEIQQGADKQRKGFAYTGSKKVAREFYLTDTWVQEKEGYSKRTHIDDKQFEYDANDQVVKVEVKRDHQPGEQTHFLQNAFGETIKEGDGVEWPLNRQFDASGAVWLDNADAGASAITLRNLAGVQTLQLKSPTDDLAKFGYDELPLVMKMDAVTLERTENERDLCGRTVAYKAPFWHELNHEGKPTHLFQYDRWNNVVHEEDSQGHATDHEYDHDDHPIVTMHPETEVINEQGEISRKRPTILNGYNERGFLIGACDGNEHTEGYVLDEAGQLVTQVLGEGTKEERLIYDILGQPEKTMDARGKVTSRQFNARGLIEELTFPSGKTQHYEYDPLGHRTLFVHESGNAYHFSYDQYGNLSERYEPMGQLTEMKYDRNRELVLERLADNNTKTWKRDPFGNVLEHKLLNGEVYYYDYDKKKQLLHEYSKQGLHGDNFLFDLEEMSRPDIDARWSEYRSRMATNPVHDVKHEYRFGLKLSDYDSELNRKINRHFDSEGLCTEEITTQRNGQVIKHLTAKRDELQREVESVDRMRTAIGGHSVFSMKRGFDGENNIRFREAHLQPVSATKKSPVKPMHKLDWYKQDAADRLVVAGGVLKDGAIQITETQGSEFEYENDLRAKETVFESSDGPKVISNLEYNDDGEVSKTQSSNGMSVQYKYHPRNRTEYIESKPGYFSRQDVYWNDNFVERHVDSYENDNNTPKSRTEMTLHPQLNLSQTVDTVSEGIHDRYQIDSIGMDSYYPSYAHGWRNEKYSGAAAMFYANDALNAKSHAADEAHSDWNEKWPSEIWPVFFDTLPNKQLISKQHVYFKDYPPLYKFSYINGYYFFHSINNGVLGLYGEKIEGFGNTSLPFTENYLNFSLPIVANRAARIAPTNKPSRNEPYMLQDVHTQALIPRVYVVSEGDTFASIAKQMYGEEEGGSKIALKNGWLESQRLSPGTVLFLPPYIPVRNKASSALPYHEFISIMSGSIAPYFPAVNPQQAQAKPKKKKGHWWKTLVKVIVVGLALFAATFFLAPALIGMMTPMLMSTLGMTAEAINASVLINSIAAGVTGGIMDAAAQGVAIGLGAQERFSWQETLQTSLSMAVMSPFAAEFAEAKTLATATTAALKVGTAAVTTQLASMAAGLTSKFDAREVIAQITATLAGAKLSQGVGKVSGHLGEAGTRVVNTAASTVMNAAVGAVVYHTPMNMESMGATAVGSLTVQHITDEISKQFQAQRVTAEFVEEAVLPEAVLDVGKGPSYRPETITRATLPRPGLDLSGKGIGKQIADYNSRVGFFQQPKVVDREKVLVEQPRSLPISGNNPSTFDVASALGRGAWRGIKNTPAGMLHMANNLHDPAKLGMEMVDGMGTTYDQFQHGDTLERAEIIGEMVGPGVLMGGLAGLAPKIGMFGRPTTTFAPGSRISERPLPYSLSNVDARLWYFAQLEKIPTFLDKSLSLREQGLRAFTLRNEFKWQARDLMADMVRAEALPPPSTLRKEVLDSYKKGNVGDELWRDIIRGSQKTNKIVDDKLGLANNFAPRRNK